MHKLRFVCNEQWVVSRKQCQFAYKISLRFPYVIVDGIFLSLRHSNALSELGQVFSAELIRSQFHFHVACNYHEKMSGSIFYCIKKFNWNIVSGRFFFHILIWKDSNCIQLLECLHCIILFQHFSHYFI